MQKMIYLREDECEQIKERADREGVSFSRFIVERALGKRRTISDYFRPQPK